MKLTLFDLYRNLYPWRNIDEFFTVIKNSIAYKSADNTLIAIHKPFGVGTYESEDKHVSKTNQDKILFSLSGSPKYCINDILDPLTSEFKSANPYRVVKSIDRYMSGITLLSNQLDADRKSYLRSVSTSRCNSLPPFGIRAITSGRPLIKGSMISEKLGVELIETDELGDFKEPVIINTITSKHKRRLVNDLTTFQAQLEIKRYNSSLAVAMVHMYFSKLRWDIPRCYLSSKASFALGDVRFSKRLRTILGQKKQIPVFNIGYQDYEPLHEKLLERLGVNSNRVIPLMMDLFSLRLKNYYPTRPEAEKDLFIISPICPLQFEATLKCLDLNNEND